jgi:hypothetical protein
MIIRWELFARGVLLRRFCTLGVGRDSASVSAYRRPMGYQQILHGTLASSTGLTLPTLANSGLVPGYAVIQCQGTATTDCIGWRDDGTAPTSGGVGMRIFSGQELDYSGDLNSIRFIVVSGSPDLNISYYA